MLTIEPVVSTPVFLLVPLLVGIGMVCVLRRNALGIAGLVAVGAAAALTTAVGVLATTAGDRARRLARGALLVPIAALFIGIAVLPRLGLYRPLTVLSGSMRPTFDPGDLVIVRPEPIADVRVGQVISYSVPVGARQVETHRVIRILKRGPHPVIQTQGDANNWRDPWTARLRGTTAWRLTAVIPYGGYAINALRSRPAHLATVVAAPAFVAFLLLGQLWGLPTRRARS